jgi:hypothetical protein
VSTNLKEYFATQPNIYGFPYISFLSYNKDSVFFVTLGKQKPSRRLAAAFNAIKRQIGYVPMLGQKPLEYLQYGYATIKNADDPELLEVIFSEKRKKGYYSVSYMEL